MAEHTVFLIDGSGSMLALDGDPDRISDARTRAVEVRSELPSGGTASVIEVGPEPRVLLSASADPDAFEEAVAATRATPGRADFAAAFALAEGLETTEAPIGFVLLSDGGLSEEEQRLLPPGTTYEQVGSAATNRAVADLDIEARSTELHVRVVVDNRGGPSAVQTLRLDVDGRTRERVELSPARRRDGGARDRPDRRRPRRRVPGGRRPAGSRQPPRRGEPPPSADTSPRRERRARPVPRRPALVHRRSHPARGRRPGPAGPHRPTTAPPSRSRPRRRSWPSARPGALQACRSPARPRLLR